MTQRDLVIGDVVSFQKSSRSPYELGVVTKTNWNGRWDDSGPEQVVGLSFGEYRDFSIHAKKCILLE